MSVEFIFRIVGMLVFGVLGAYLGIYIGNSTGQTPELTGFLFCLVGILFGLILTPYFTTRPMRIIRRTLLSVSTQTLASGLTGMVVGLIIAALLTFPLSLLPNPFGKILPFVAVVLFGYLGIAIFVMRQTDLFSMFRFSPGHSSDDSSAANQPTYRTVLLDTSTPLRISDMDVEGVREVDDKLVVLARQLKCPILTNDYNLNRIAELQGVSVLNVNELANAVKLVFLPGESIEVNVIQEGKESGQGVGYLDDGTMVVVEDGRNHLNKKINVTVTKVLQTAAGRMIFARMERED